MHSQSTSKVASVRNSRTGGWTHLAAIRPPPVPRPMWAVFALIGLSAVLGFYNAQIAHVGAFAPTREISEGLTVALVVSGVLLAAAAWVALRAWREEALGGAALALAVLFAYMMADEVGTIHEELSTALEADWIILYLPVMALAGVAWLLVLRGLSGVWERILWAGGAAAWVASVGLEELAWAGEEKVAAAGELAGAEEILEMTGTGLFIWALLLAIYRVRDRRASRTASA